MENTQDFSFSHYVKERYINLLKEYELLLGDYEEIEQWISEGRVDFGFLRLPASKTLDCIEIEKDQQMVVLPKNHPLAKRKKFPVRQLSNYPFIRLEKGVEAEITEIFVKNKIVPNTKFTTFDDYAVMSMVEKNLGIAMKNKKELSLAARRFLEYLDFR